MLVILASATLAAGKEDIVRLRQQGMKQMAAAAKTISEMFGGKRDFDGSDLSEAAGVLKEHSGKTLGSQFPKGSLGAPSDAADRIAAERVAFDTIADRLSELAIAFDKQTRTALSITQAMRMGSSAMGGGSLLGARKSPGVVDLTTVPAEHLFHMMLDTCSNCHSKYRIRAQ